MATNTATTATTHTGNGSTTTLVPAYDATHDLDFSFLKSVNPNQSWYLGDRLRGQRQFYSDTQSQEVTGTYTCLLYTSPSPRD